MFLKYMNHEIQPVETSSIILPQDDAQKVVEHLIELGFTFCPGVIFCHSPSEAYDMDTLEDGDGRMVVVERHKDRTIIEMGADLAHYLSDSGFYA